MWWPFGCWWDVKLQEPLKHSDGSKDWLIPNNAFKISNRVRSLLTRDSTCNQMKNYIHLNDDSKSSCTVQYGGQIETLWGKRRDLEFSTRSTLQYCIALLWSIGCAKNFFHGDANAYYTTGSPPFFIFFFYVAKMKKIRTFCLQAKWSHFRLCFLSD